VVGIGEILGLSLGGSGAGDRQVPAEVLRLVEERETARRTRNWAAADELRGRIRELGFLVEDRQDGPLVKAAGD
jgi:cysteinyl-tRNA synthetase